MACCVAHVDLTATGAVVEVALYLAMGFAALTLSRGSRGSSSEHGASTVSLAEDEDESRAALALACSNLLIWDWDVPQRKVTLLVATTTGSEAGSYRREELSIEEVRRRLHPDDRRAVITSLRAHLRGECPFYEADYRIREGDGWRWVHDRGRVALRDASGRPVRIVGTERDVSLQKGLEAQLRQSQKLESIGALAAGIAHEINTPTQYVGDNVHFLRDAYEELLSYIDAVEALLDEARRGPVSRDTLERCIAAHDSADLEFLRGEIPKAIKQAEEGVSRVSTIVRAMKDFSHPGTTEKQPFDINRAIESTATVARNEWKYVARMELDLSPDLPLVPCLPGEFNQVILNLIINAAQAISARLGPSPEEQGKIGISTRRVPEGIEISVSDTGTGIADEIRERVFDPFFTTKPVGQGTGQGLAIARSVIVDKHGGSIDFTSAKDSGTTFTIRLPLAP